MEEKYFFLFVVFLFVITLVSSAQISSSNYNIDANVVSSGGTKTNSSNFMSKLVLGILSGASSSINFNNFLGLFYGADTTEPVIEIKFPVQGKLYNVFIGDLNYTVDATSLYCWHSKDNGLTNSTPVVARTNWTNIYSRTVTGKNNWTIYCNDSAGNIGKAFVNFSVDDKVPNVYFSGSTPIDNEILQDSFFTINVTSSDESGEHSTFLDFNNSLVGWWKLEERIDLSPSIRTFTSSHHSGRTTSSLEYIESPIINDFSIKVQGLTSGLDSAYTLTSDYIDIVPNKAYTFSFYYKTNSTSVTYMEARASGHTSKIMWYDASNNLIRFDNLGSNKPIVRNTWQQFNITSTSPSNAVRCKVAIGQDSPNFETGDISYVLYPELKETYFYDSSNYNNHGICAGSSCPSVTGGKRGLAYEFDGVDDYIEISHDENFAPTSITVSGWVKLKSSTLWMLVNKAHGTTPGSYYIYGTNINDAKWSITDSTATRHTSSLGSLSLDTWYFLVGTYDDNTGIMRSYKNGELIDSKTGVGLGLNTDNLLIGKYVSQYNFNGSIDDVMIFNRALSEDEIKSIYNAQSKQYENIFQNIGNGEYNYTVYSQDLAGNVNSSTRKLTINMAPSGLNVSVLEDKNLNSKQGALNLTWIDSSVGEEGFSIERSSDNSTFIEINRTIENIITYTDDNLPDNSIFFYKLRSFTGGAYSSYSNIAYNITADRTPPLNPLITLFANSTANGVNVKIDDTSPGLILYLPFEEGTGTTAYDWSGEENHGTIYEATYVDGNEGNGKALNFDGIDDKILLSENIHLRNNVEWTVSTFIKTTKTGMNSIMSHHNSGPVYSAFITNNGKIAYHYYNGAWLTVSGNFIINDGNWHHLVWKHYSNNSMEFYVDGIKDGSTFDSTISSANNPIDIIGQRWSGGNPFNGSIDEVRIYNRALTQREIINDMQSGLIKYKLYMSEAYNGNYLDVNNPIINGDAEFGNLTNFAFDGVTSDSYEGDYAFYETGGKDLQSLYLIPIDNNSEYVLSGMFKSNGTGGLSQLYFGFVPYDKNKVRILNENINIVQNTETELYQDIEPTDKIIKVKNCANWYTLSHGRVAFNIDDSGNYADLPNRELSNSNIIGILKKDNYCEIEFNTVVGKSYPANTKVRMHTSGGTYMYSAAGGVNIPITWKEYSTSKMKGSNLYGANYGSSFWPGTKYVKILFLLNYQQGSSYTTLVDNVKLTVNNGSMSNSYYLSPASTDRASPSNVTNLTSEDVKEGNFYTINEVTFTWDESVDYGTNYSFYLTTEDKAGNYNNTINMSNSTNVITGIAGYSVLCDDWKNSIPNNIIDVAETNYTCSLTEGENYFFVKAIDGAGNSGNITRFGPFFVDTGIPNIYFVSPTPVNATQTTEANTTIKIEVKDYSLSNLNFTWNDTIFEVLGDNLVLLLNFENLKTLGENNTLAKDLTKYGNDALLHGVTYSEDGKYGKSISLDGINNYLSTNISQAKRINITMSAWVKSNKLLHQSIISQAKGSLHYRGIRLTQTGISLWARDSGTAWQDSIYEIDYTNKWIHVVGIQEENELRLYVNGELASVNDIGSNSGELSENFEIGRYTTGDYYFNGTIDEVKIYNRSLSSEEVKLLYNSNIQRHSQTDWSLIMNLTNLSRGSFQYNSSACDMTNNCNSTETRVWSRLNIPPVITDVKINMTNGIMRATQNMSITELVFYDLDPEDRVFNIMDWRESNQSIALLNMPFEGGSNSIWTKDYSKNLNHGTVNGATWTTNGKVGGAYEFDGVDDYISLPFGKGWNISQTNPLTISMWVKPNFVDSNQMIIHSNSDANNRLYIGIYSGRWSLGIQSSAWSSTSKHATINWQYITLIMDGEIAKLYVDGDYVTQKNYTPYNLTNNFWLSGNHGSSYYFNGTIDEVMIFNRSISEEQINLIYQAGLNNHSLENISSSELKDRERWKVVVTPNDLIEDGEPLESNELYLHNNLPVVTLNYPQNNSEIINRTPEFNWTGYDNDGDPLTYQLEIREQKNSGTAICDDDIYRNNLNENNWIANQDLKCLGDYGYYYQWRVRAHDGESFGEWTPYNKFTLNAYVVISLLNNEVNFGTIDYLSSNNTSDGNPQPFVIKNSGNVKINVSTNSTPMWQSEQDDSKYYMTKVDYRVGFEGAFNWISSVVEWINMSITGKVTLIDQLDYHESNNTAEVDIHLEVPPNEGPGLKSATVIFEAKFSEDEA